MNTYQPNSVLIITHTYVSIMDLEVINHAKTNWDAISLIFVASTNLVISALSYSYKNGDTQ